MSGFIDWMTKTLTRIRVKRNAPPSAKDVDELETRINFSLPKDYREILLYSNGTTFTSENEVFSLFDLEDIFLLNDDPDYSEKLQGLFIIGNDNGDSLYALDPHGIWDKGTMALFRLDSSALKKSTSQYLGANIKEVLLKINNGQSFSRLPSLEDGIDS